MNPRSRLAEWFADFERRIKVPLGYAPETLAKKLYGVSFAEAEEFGASVFRKYVLEQPDSNMKETVDCTLKTWAARSVKTKQQNGDDE